MIVFKIFYRINSFIKKHLYKLVYGKHFKFGKKFHFRKCFNLAIEKNGKLCIGDNVFFNNSCSISCLNQITIGNNVLFGQNVQVYDHNHRYDINGVKHHAFSTAPITIGDNSWICSNVVITKGVSIGKNVIIGANSVITTDIPDNTRVYQSRELVEDIIL